MTTLSVIVLTKNEQQNISECLSSVQWADEIIIYDNSSTDDTVKIAEAFTSKIIIDADWQGFGQQRQKAQDHASCEWILTLDADERVTKKLATEICRCVKQNNQSSLYSVPRLSWCFGRFIRHSGWYPDYVRRLYARKKTSYNSASVHEKVELPSSMTEEFLTGDLLHYTYNDLHHYLVKSAYYAKLWADDKQQKNKTSNLLQAGLHGVGCFIKMYILRLGFLDGKQGLLLALLSGHSTFAKYADLWTRSRVNISNQQAHNE